MPSYQVIYTTSHGPQYSRFTLEDDVEIGVQVGQVVEELRGRGDILLGGPDDELAVFWNGTELDSAKAPRDLGIGTVRAIELRMRPRPVRSHTVLAESYFPKASYTAAALGATAGALAWGASLTVSDLNAALPTFVSRDIALATLLGALVGGSTLWFEAHRRLRARAGQGLLGVVLGGVAALLASWAATTFHNAGSPASFARILGDRVLAWSLVAGLLSLALGIVRHRGRPSKLGLAVLFGLLAGALAAITYNFPGPTALWNGLALSIVGAAIGFCVTGLQLGGYRALLEVEAVDQRAVGLLGARGMQLLANVPVELRQLGRRASGGGVRATAVFDGQAVALQPIGSDGVGVRGAMVRVGGEDIASTVLLGDGETIDIGSTRYRLHLLASRERS